jgi:hypothetical protein
MEILRRTAPKRSVVENGQVDQIVLTASTDSDFVHVFGQTDPQRGNRRDPGPHVATLSDDIYEHIDGLRSTYPRPKMRGRQKGLRIASP